MTPAVNPITGVDRTDTYIPMSSRNKYSSQDNETTD